MISSLSHFIALFEGGGFKIVEPYYIYAYDPKILLAIQIFYVGQVFLFIGFQMGNASIGQGGILPKIQFSLPENFSYTRYSILLLILCYLAYTDIIPDLGTITSVIKALPLVSIFFITRKGATEDNDKLLNLALLLVFAQSCLSVLYSFLRFEMILPSYAFILGLFVGKPYIKTFFSLRFIPLYLFISIFFSYFVLFGEARSRISSGVQRIAQIEAYRIEKEMLKEVATEEKEEVTIFVRMSLINQLSHIGRVVEEDGYYFGQTIEYFTYAFIPRFIWPEKPLIANGGWYAHRIGQAIDYGNGVYSNSINMTVPGELYLNFGWMGMTLGCIIFGYFYSVLWQSTNFWRDHKNFFGSLFALNLFIVAFNQMGADLQIVITLLAQYLIFVFASKIFGT